MYYIIMFSHLTRIFSTKTCFLGKNEHIVKSKDFNNIGFLYLKVENFRRVVFDFELNIYIKYKCILRINTLFSEIVMINNDYCISKRLFSISCTHSIVFLERKIIMIDLIVKIVKIGQNNFYELRNYIRGL